MKLTKNDRYMILSCVNTFEYSMRIGMLKDFDLLEFKKVFELVTFIKIDTIENLSITWQNDGFIDGKNCYYKVYEITLQTNDKFEITIYADKDYNTTDIYFNMSNISITL